MCEQQNSQERDCIVSVTPPLHISQNALVEKNGINRADFEKEKSQEISEEMNEEMNELINESRSKV